MCILKFYSEKVSFNEYAKNTCMPILNVKDSNDLRSRATGELWGINFISFDVSNKEWNLFPEQVHDAVLFLNKYQDEILNLVKKYNISDAYIDFPLWSRLSDEIINQNDHLPHNLIAICGALGLGIEMSIYSKDLDGSEDGRY